MAIPLRASYPAVGDVIDGKYRILSVLGEGGMGMVAKAHHTLRGVPVALKFVAPHILASEGGVERFLNEARFASQIPSEHVVGILDVGKLPSGAPYMVMEYLEGRDVAALRDAAGPGGVEAGLAVHVMLQILRALQAAHAVGVVHRDLKPSNVFLTTRDGDSEFVKLLDFGVSKARAGASVTATNAALGTPLYMSPEQARNPRDVDGRADLYSAGVILYELLGGRTPYVSDSGEATEVILKLFTEDPPRLDSLRKDLPPGLADAVHAALARERGARFADAAAFAEALAPFALPRSESTLEKIRAFVAPHTVVAPVSGPDAFEGLRADPLAATQAAASVSPAARTQTAVSAEMASKPPPAPRSLAWVVAALAVAVAASAGVAVKLAASRDRGATTAVAPPPPASQPPPVPPPPPSTPSTVVVAPPSASGAASLRPPPSPPSTVHLKDLGLGQ